MFVRMFGANVAQAARDHDGLVVAAHFARDVLFEGAEISGEIGSPEFVVERCRADRTFEHDRQRRRHAVRLAVFGLPRLRERRDAQMRNGESDQSGLRLAADARSTFVPDLAAGSGRCARERRDRRRVVVRLDLHQDVGRLATRAVATVLARIEACGHRAFHHRGIVRVRNDRSLRMRLVRIADHAEQALLLFHAVDDVLRVEYLVPAVFGICLCEHHQLDIGRIAAKRAEICVEVVDLVGRERQAQPLVRAFQCRTALLQQRNRRQRYRRKVCEEFLRIGQVGEDRLDHSIVEKRQKRGAVIHCQRSAVGRGNAIHHAAFNARDGRQAAVLRDVGRLRRPWRERAGTGNHKE